MPFALATASAPARTARAIGLPALLVKTPMVSASAGGPTNDNPPAIAAAANQVPGHFIASLPGSASQVAQILQLVPGGRERPKVRASRGHLSFPDPASYPATPYPPPPLLSYSPPHT